jgi:protein SCO1
MLKPLDTRGGLWACLRFSVPARALGADAVHVNHQFSNANVKRTVHHYFVPARRVIWEDGAQVTLNLEPNDGGPVVFNCTCTSCTTICPLSSQERNSAGCNSNLGAERNSVCLVSISIDSGIDTAAQLRDQAQRFGAAAPCHYYTGSVEPSPQTQISFGIYCDVKMTHGQATLLRAVLGEEWVHFGGFVKAEELYAELDATYAVSQMAEP